MSPHFYPLFILFFKFTNALITHKHYKLMDALVLQDQKNLFDNNYLIYSRKYIDQRVKIFGYDNHTVCMADYIGDKMFINFESPYNHFVSSKRLILNNRRNIDLQACFNYKGHTFLIFKNGNETIFSRSGNEKILKFDHEYKKFIYDHISQKLFLQIDYKIYKIDINIIAQWWTNIVPLSSKIRLKLESVLNLDPKWIDFILLNDTFYYINGHTIYRYFMDYNPTTIKSFNPELISNINSKFFNFLLFPGNFNENDLDFLENQLINIATDNDSDSNWIIDHWLSFSLIIKFLIILSIIFCFRKKMTKFVNKKFKKSKDQNSDYFIDDEPAVYPTTPLTKISSAQK